MSIQALREKRAAAGLKLKALVEVEDGATAKAKAWTAENQSSYDQLVAEIEDIDGNIERHQKSLDVAAKSANEIRAISEKRGISVDYAAEVQREVSNMLAAWVRNGVAGLNEEQARIQQSRFLEIRNVMSTGTGAEGRFTVPTEMARTMSEAMAAYGGMREAGEVFRTEGGAAMPYPTTDGTAEEGEIIAENQTATDEDPNFGTLSLDTHKFSSKVITVPFELIQDSAFDIEAFVRGRIEQRLGRITNRMYTVGTGVAQPNGVVTASLAGKVGLTGQTASVIFDDLVDLEHSVDPSYRSAPGCGYMFHDTTLRELKKLKDTTGRPLWLAGHDVAAPDLINGKPYRINQDVAPMAANARSILFGDFKHYKIRDVMAILLFRFNDSAYAKLGQVGFLAWMRSGGNLIDVGGAVKHYQNPAT